MVGVDGQMAEEEEKSGLSRQAFTNEQEPERSQAGWLHAGKLRLPTPLSFGVSGTVARRNGAVGLISWRTYPQCQVFNQEQNCQWWLQWA
jgi:hypothetical protein